MTRYGKVRQLFIMRIKCLRIDSFGDHVRNIRKAMSWHQCQQMTMILHMVEDDKGHVFISAGKGSLDTEGGNYIV